VATNVREREKSVVFIMALVFFREANGIESHQNYLGNPELKNTDGGLGLRVKPAFQAPRK
jgi:hypothetical protein